jgi:hypothetical protein
VLQGTDCKIHSHACFLRTLTGKNVYGGGLRDFGGPFENFLAAIIDCLNLDNNITIAHTDVMGVDLEFITRKYHSNGNNIVSARNNEKMATESIEEGTYARTSIGMTFRNDTLDAEYCSLVKGELKTVEPSFNIV